MAKPKTNSAGKRGRQNKIDRVTALLRRGEGATLAEIVSSTGWQPHSARAALTGLKKKGHAVERTQRDDATCYRISEAV